MNSEYPHGFNTFFQNYQSFPHFPHYPQYQHIPQYQHMPPQYYFHGQDYNNLNNGIYNEFREMRKHIDALTIEINKLKSLLELQQTNSVISNNFIDKTVDKLKSFDTRLNYAFTKINKLENNNSNNNNLQTNIKESNKTNNPNIRFNMNDTNRNMFSPFGSTFNSMNTGLPPFGQSQNSKPTKENNVNKRNINPIQRPPLQNIIRITPSTSNTFPLSSLFNMINNSQSESTKKEKQNDLIDSEDEYDMNTEIYAEPDIKKIDNDVLEVKLDIKSIDDLIDIGIKYRNELDSNNKKDKKDKKETKNKKEKKEKPKKIIKQKDDSSDSEEETAGTGLILFNSSFELKDNSNNSSDDFSGFLHKAIQEAFQEAIEKTEKQIDEENEKLNLNKEDTEDNKDKKNPEYYIFNGKKYSVDINKIINLIEPLQKLKNIIGMNKIKENILEMILYYIQNFESKTSDMLHTSIEGPPGVGKTKLGRILAQVYHGLGVIPSKRFKRVRRTDLIGKYLGHTAHKTQEVIDEAEGGVLFIDEAYSLGAEGEKDIYSKECIDTINMNLTEKKKNLIVIIAGYTDQLDKSFFAANEGLKRRFPFRFTIDGYNEKEMKDIFYAQIRRLKWKLHPEVSIDYLENFFKKNKKDFPHFGGDIETVILNCKMSHAKRVIGKPNIYHKILTIDDINNAFDKFKQNKKKEENINHLHSMYT